MKAAMRDAAKTGVNGLLLIAAVFGFLVAGPHVELAFAPPVALFEIHKPRIETGRLVWSVLVAQQRRCVPTIEWSSGGTRLSATGPALALAPGDAGEVGPFSAPLQQGRAGPTLDATVIYNCGAPWGLAPIRKSVPIS